MSGVESYARSPAPRRGRQADSARRRQRVLDVLGRVAGSGDGVSVAGVARAARVDRTFLYRHPDLLALVRDRAGASTVPARSGDCGCPCAAEVTRLAGQVAEVRRHLADLRRHLAGPVTPGEPS